MWDKLNYKLKLGFLLILCVFGLMVFINGLSFEDSSPNFYNNNYLKEDPTNKEPIEQFPNSAAPSPNGKPLLVEQHANISKTYSNVGNNQNITFPVVPNWIVKNTTVY